MVIFHTCRPSELHRRRSAQEAASRLQRLSAQEHKLYYVSAAAVMISVKYHLSSSRGQMFGASTTHTAKMKSCSARLTWFLLQLDCPPSNAYQAQARPTRQDISFGRVAWVKNGKSSGQSSLDSAETVHPSLVKQGLIDTSLAAPVVLQG
eukprot:TRINITY_DN43732_c0_g1_i4.p1 TRINITY_DN43732_c0_g1~~TRINITY_DN43732_c0_g1_i4.p1  ORF type:complete len:150 (+),score=4.47 TRINITY_DN43732_c0_g1_i4:334-783(+)